MISNIKKNNDYLIRYLQFFVVILSVIQHSIIVYTQQNNPSYYLKTFTEISDICLIPIFIFISGLLLSKKVTKITFKTLCIKQIPLIFLYCLGITIITPLSTYFIVENPTQTFSQYYHSYNILLSSPGIFWILPVIILLNIFFYLLISSNIFNKITTLIENLDKTHLIVVIFLTLFFAYFIPYIIDPEHTFLTLPLKENQWFSLGPLWIPKTKSALLIALFFLGTIVSHSQKMLSYTLSAHNKLSETYIYKVIESIILYTLFSTLHEKDSFHSQNVANFLHTLLYLLLLVSLLMSLLGIFNKVCTKRSMLLSSLSKYNYFIYSFSILNISIWYNLLSHSVLSYQQALYIIILLSITSSYILGIIIRKIPIINRLIL